MWSLNSDSLGAVTTSLENQFQWPTVLCEEPFPNILFECPRAASHHFHVSCPHSPEREDQPLLSTDLLGAAVHCNEATSQSSKFNKPSGLSYFSKVFLLRRFTISVALWTHSRSFLSLLYWGCPKLPIPHECGVLQHNPCLGRAALHSCVTWRVNTEC